MIMANKIATYGLALTLLFIPLLGSTIDNDETNQVSNGVSHSFSEATIFQYIEQNKEKYLLSNPRENYKLDTIQLDKFGLTHTRLQQYYHGVPIYGASLRFHQDSSGNLLSESGKPTQFNKAIIIEPTIASSAAIGIAKNHLAQLKANDQTVSKKVKVTVPELYIYDHSNPKLVWRFLVGVKDTPIQYVYYINAHTGMVEHYLNTTAHARNRETYVLNTTPDCNTETLTYEESGLVGTYDADAGWVHLYAGYAYDYFYDTFGRDSFDDADPDDSTDGGGTVKSYTHYHDPDACTDEFDAAWVSQSTEPYEFMYFAEGVYDQDIVGHEFTHGVIDHSADLEYENESGALDESYADIFGTLIEHSTGGTDWTIGEDLPSNRSGCTTALRSLADPTAYTGYCDGSGSILPGHIIDEVMLTDPTLASESNDYGYVHTNSSISNHAFYLLSQGGTHSYSGIAVTGIGEEAAAQIYYETLTNYLDIQSDFDDAYTETM